MESVILEEDIDENYEPTEAEIEEYAQWLGMVSPDDDDLRWIAREGLKAPLPEHWKVRSYTPTPSLPFKKVALSRSRCLHAVNGPILLRSRARPTTER